MDEDTTKPYKDFPADFDALNYLETRRRSVLHTLKGYAQGIKEAQLQRDPCSGVGDCVVDLINFNCIFGGMLPYMKSPEAKAVWLDLTKAIALAVGLSLNEKRLEASLKTPNGEIQTTLENMVKNYDKLIEALKAQSR